MSSTTSTSTRASGGRISIRRDTTFPPAELEKAAQILRDGFWNCNSPVLRFRAHNDRQALLELMRSRVKAAAGVGGLILAYLDSQTAVMGNVEAEEAGKELVGAVIVSLPGEGFTQLQKNYGDQQSSPSDSAPALAPAAPALAETPKEESEAERKTRIWVETDLVPWFQDFTARSYGPGVLEQSLYVSLFAMRQDVQGRGLGREVMDRVMEWGDGEGWEMTLCDHEPELVKFYSSFGFQEVGKEVRACDGTDVTWWAMKRPRRQAV